MAENEQLNAAQVQEIEPENFEVENFIYEETNNLPEIALICAGLTLIVLTVAYVIFRRMQNNKGSPSEEQEFTPVSQEDNDELNPDSKVVVPIEN